MELGDSPQKKNGSKRKLKPMAKKVNTTTTTQKCNHGHIEHLCPPT
jgi:hypothetical protein